MVDEVLPHGPVHSRGDRDLQLRTDSVGRGDEERVGHPGEIRTEEAAESPDVAHHALRERGADRVFRARDGAHLRVDVDAGIRVGRPAGIRHGADRSRALRHRTAASRGESASLTTLSGDVSPERIVTSDAARPKASATRETTSLFALPFSGGAFTDSLSAPPWAPSTRRREAPAETRRRRRTLRPSSSVENSSESAATSEAAVRALRRARAVGRSGRASLRRRLRAARRRGRAWPEDRAP